MRAAQRVPASLRGIGVIANATSVDLQVSI